jgi:DNA-binding NarL/FixJ family response regulator
MTTDRADRPAFAAEDAAAELRKLASQGVREPRAANALLVAAGHSSAEGSAVPRIRADSPVARSTSCGLAARGLTTQEIADRLYISPKTTDHHIQHIYNKVNVSMRAAARLAPNFSDAYD